MIHKEEKNSKGRKHCQYAIRTGHQREQEPRKLYSMYIFVVVERSNMQKIQLGVGYESCKTGQHAIGDGVRDNSWFGDHVSLVNYGYRECTITHDAESGLNCSCRSRLLWYSSVSGAVKMYRSLSRQSIQLRDSFHSNTVFCSLNTLAILNRDCETQIL